MTITMIFFREFPSGKRRFIPGKSTGENLPNFEDPMFTPKNLYQGVPRFKLNPNMYLVISFDKMGKNTGPRYSGGSPNSSYRINGQFLRDILRHDSVFFFFCILLSTY